MFADALKRFGVFESVVGEVGATKEGFVHGGLRVGGQIKFGAQHLQRVSEGNVVGDVGSGEMCADDFLVEGPSVVCDPHVVFAERVGFSNRILRGEKVFVRQHFGDTFGLFFRREASHRGVQIPLFAQEFGPETHGSLGVLSQRVQGFVGWFGSDGVDHALKRFASFHHADFEELRVFPLKPFAQEAGFRVVEQHFLVDRDGVYIYTRDRETMSYFIGNVLSPTETQPEQEDKTFMFTRREAAELELKGVPIRMEHDENLEVGNIVSAWDGRDGSKWIMGRIDESSMRGKFAKHAIAQSSNGTRYYTGLSLQHTHTQYASGGTRKDAVEVSLCVDPRRDDCRITFVDTSKKADYKGGSGTIKMPETEVTTPQEQTVVETPAEVPAPSEPVKADEPSEEFQREFIKLARERDELEKQLQVHREAEKKRHLEAQAKAEALVKTVVAEWGQQVGDVDIKDAEASMMKMAKEFPKESQEFLQIAHYASKKHAQERDTLKKTKQKTEASQIKETFNKVMTKQVHAASAKKKETKTHFMDALNQYRNPGSGRDLMEEIVKNNKRRRMY